MTPDWLQQHSSHHAALAALRNVGFRQVDAKAAVTQSGFFTRKRKKKGTYKK